MWKNEYKAAILPFPFRDLIKILKEKNCNKLEGIYRIAGSANNVNKIKERYNNLKLWNNKITKVSPQLSKENLNYLRAEDAHVLSSTLKMYLRENYSNLLTSLNKSAAIKGSFLIS